MPVQSRRVWWEECARRRRCHGRLRDQQVECAGVRRRGCDVVDAVMGGGSDDDEEDDGKEEKAKKWRRITKSVRCPGCDGVFLVAQPECYCQLKCPFL